MRINRGPRRPEPLDEPWATSVREAHAARSVLRRSLERWPAGPSESPLHRLARAADDAVSATWDAGEAAHQLAAVAFGGVPGCLDPTGPCADAGVGGARSVPLRLHDEALRLRLCVLDLDDIAVEAAEASSVGSSRLHRTSVDLEPRMAQVLGDLRSVRSELLA